MDARGAFACTALSRASINVYLHFANNAKDPPVINVARWPVEPLSIFRTHGVTALAFTVPLMLIYSTSGKQSCSYRCLHLTIITKLSFFFFFFVFFVRGKFIMKLLINRSVKRLLPVGKRGSAGGVFSYLLMCGAENHQVLFWSRPKLRRVAGARDGAECKH